MELLLILFFLIAAILFFIVWDKFSKQPIDGWGVFFEKLLQTFFGCALIGLFSFFLLLSNNKSYLTHYDNLPIFIGGILACLVLIVVAVIAGALIYVQMDKYDSAIRSDILDYGMLDN